MTLTCQEASQSGFGWRPRRRAGPIPGVWRSTGRCRPSRSAAPLIKRGPRPASLAASPGSALPAERDAANLLRRRPASMSFTTTRGPLGGEPPGQRRADGRCRRRLMTTPAPATELHRAPAGAGGQPGPGWPARPRCKSGVPNPIDELVARFRYRCAGCFPR